MISLERWNPFCSRLHPDDADATWKAIERHLKERVPIHVEYRLRIKADTYQWFFARGQAVWDSAGNAIRM